MLRLTTNAGREPPRRQSHADALKAITPVPKVWKKPGPKPAPLRMDKRQKADTKLVLRSVIEVTGVPYCEIRGKRRAEPTMSARVLTYRMLRQHTKLSTTQIAKVTSRRDHTAVLSGLKSAQARFEKNARFALWCSMVDEKITLALDNAEEPDHG